MEIAFFIVVGLLCLVAIGILAVSYQMYKMCDQVMSFLYAVQTDIYFTSSQEDVTTLILSDN